MADLLSGRGLAIVGAVAQRLNSGAPQEETVAAVAETLRTQLPAEAVALWVHEPNCDHLRAHRQRRGHGRRRPGAAAGPAPRHGATGAERLALVHDSETLGVLEVHGAAPEAGVVLRVVAHVLVAVPRRGRAVGGPGLRGRVAVARDRGAAPLHALVIDSLPVGLYVVDRDYRIQVWNRKRETGTQGLRRDEVVGRPVFEVLTRQPAEQLKAEFDQVFETGEIQQMEIEVAVGGRAALLPDQQDPDAAGRGEHHPRHHHRRGRHRVARRSQQRILQSEKLAAIGQLAAGVMHEINNPLATIGACVAAHRRAGWRSCRPQQAAPLQEYLEIIDKEVQRCTRIVDGLLDFSRPKGKRKSAGAHQRRWSRTPSSCSSTTSASSSSRCSVELGRRTAGRATANAEQLIQVLHGADAERARRDGAGRHAHASARAPTRARADEVVVEIEDTGVGIPRADPGQDLRAVLHHQAAGPRHRARPLDLLRHRGGAPRPHRGGQPARAAARPSGSSCPGAADAA